MQLCYALYFYSRILFLDTDKPARETNARQPASIIICAKNEAQNLIANLPLILEQNYFTNTGQPLFEVLVINDASTDDTAQVTLGLQQRYAHLRLINIPAGTPHTLKGKKFALKTGVAAAAHEWLLLTDADCLPSGKNWLREMAAPLAEGKQIVAGYGGYFKAPGLLNAFNRWETIHTFLQLFSYAKAGLPYMAVGRNMACTKTVMQLAEQSAVWNLSPSGDDDLLVKVCGTPANYAVVANAGAFTHTSAQTSLKGWMKQKQRHLSDGKSYKPGIQYLLGSYGYTLAAVWLYSAVLLFTGYWQWTLALMAARCIIYWWLWSVTARKLKVNDIFYLMPLFDIGWMVFNFAFFPYIALKNKQHWK